MSPAAELQLQWTDALRRWLEKRDENALAAAYTLGRRALTNGLGIVALAEVHAHALRQSASADVAEAPRFFAEALGPADLALRGYRDATAELRRIAQENEERAEERGRQLVIAEQRYQGLIEQLPVVTYEAGRSFDAAMEFVSPQIEPLTGYSAEGWRALPGHFGGRLHPDDVDRVHAEFERSADASSPFRIEYRLLRKDGSIAWIRDEGRWTQQDGRRVQRGVWLDVTEMRVIEERLRQTQKLDAIGRLAAGVAHDFNNILTAVLAFSRFVADDLGPDHPSASDMRDILASAERGASITRQLLAFSRQQSPSAAEVDAGETARAMEKMLSRLLGERISLRVTGGEKLHAVHADPSYIEQVILNLVVNAGDAIVGPGTVTVQTSNAVIDGTYVKGVLGARPGEYVVIAVSDTGVGMDDRTQARIFEPFFTTKDKGKGTGLGLSTVYGIVRQLGGDISVYSTLGRGTTFKVYLPRSYEERAESSDHELEAIFGSETVLLAEDDPAVREVAARTLRRAGFTVVEAGELKAAAEAAAKNEGRIDLLVTDVILGQHTGAELSQVLPSLPVLFMSGYSEHALAPQGVTTSSETFIEKPFTPQAFLRKVRRVLDGRESNR